MLLNDKEIIDLCNGYKPLITPFSSDLVRQVADKKIISYGVSSYGYDLRAGDEYKVFTNVSCKEIDPKNIDEDTFITVKKDKDYILIPPNGFILTYSQEHLCIPRNVTGIVIGKSTYARAGIVCICTPLESGWSGHVTLEFANTTSLPVRFYPGEGCCQVLFLTGNECGVSYADRGGKYMNQGKEVVLPKV